MRRLFKIGWALFLVNLAARPLISYLAFNHIDLRDLAVAELLALPAFQAVLLWWVLRPSTLPSIRASWGRVIRSHKAIGIFLMLDAMLLPAAWIFGGESWLSLVRQQSLPNYYTGLKAFAAGTVILAVLRSWRLSGLQRSSVCIFGVGLWAYGLDYFVGWQRRLSDSILPGKSLLVAWVLTYGLLFALAMMMLLRMEGIARLRSESAAWLMQWAPALACLAAIIVSISSYDRTELEQPWATIVRSCSFLAISAIWSGTLALTGSEGNPGENRG